MVEISATTLKNWKNAWIIVYIVFWVNQYYPWGKKWILEMAVDPQELNEVVAPVVAFVPDVIVCLLQAYST